MGLQRTMALIREYDPTTDYPALRTCFIELQAWEQSFEPGLPAPEEAADPYLADVFRDCAESSAAWDDPVNGAELFDDIATAIRRYVVMPDYVRDADALWVAHTYLLDRLMITPRLGITSPVKGCGKTTLLDVLFHLVFRPLMASNCSPSSIFRVVEKYRPTLLVDEADSFLSNNEELRGVLNSGHRRGGSVLRNVGDDHEPRAFSTYAACVIALIGRLPGTLDDRAVPNGLARRKPDEAIETFRFDRVDHLTVLARKLMRWSKDNAEAIAATEPEIPAGLYNRTADNWRGLLAIATIAGGDWLARGHKAALASVGADVDEGSRLELLLGDVRDIYDELKVDRIAGATLIERLCEITPRPWIEFGRSGKPITPNKLARLFKPLGIAPQQIRVEGEKTRGL
jgi:putative DNA primase/helicase